MEHPHLIFDPALGLQSAQEKKSTLMRKDSDQARVVERELMWARELMERDDSMSKTDTISNAGEEIDWLSI